MPKTSAIERNKKRILLVAKHASKRAEIKAALVNPATTDDEFFALSKKLQKMPRNSSAVRVKNRCSMSGRPPRLFGSLVSHVSNSVNWRWRVKFPV